MLILRRSLKIQQEVTRGLPGGLHVERLVKSDWRSRKDHLLWHENGQAGQGTQ